MANQGLAILYQSDINSEPKVFGSTFDNSNDAVDILSATFAISTEEKVGLQLEITASLDNGGSLRSYQDFYICQVVSKNDDDNSVVCRFLDEKAGAFVATKFEKYDGWVNTACVVEYEERHCLERPFSDLLRENEYVYNDDDIFDVPELVEYNWDQHPDPLEGFPVKYIFNDCNNLNGSKTCHEKGVESYSAECTLLSGKRRNDEEMIGIRHLVDSRPYGYFSLFARQNIRRGDFIDTYSGEVFESVRYYKVFVRSNYVFEVPVETTAGKRVTFVVDAKKKGSLCRFANHSHRPNARYKFLIHEGQLVIAMFALRAILAREEITVDYGWVTDNESLLRIPCNCGCKKTLYRKLGADSEDEEDASEEEKEEDGYVPEDNEPREPAAPASSARLQPSRAQQRGHQSRQQQQRQTQVVQEQVQVQAQQPRRQQPRQAQQVQGGVQDRRQEPPRQQQRQPQQRPAQLQGQQRLPQVQGQPEQVQVQPQVRRSRRLRKNQSQQGQAPVQAQRQPQQQQGRPLQVEGLAQAQAQEQQPPQPAQPQHVQVRAQGGQPRRRGARQRQQHRMVRRSQTRKLRPRRR